MTLPTAPADEPWHALPPPDQKALERAARAMLCLTLPPETAALVRRGRCPELVAAAMRRLFPSRPAPRRANRRPARTNADADVWDII